MMKKLLREQIGHPVKRQRLFFNGKELNNVQGLYDVRAEESPSGCS